MKDKPTTFSPTEAVNEYLIRDRVADLQIQEQEGVAIQYKLHALSPSSASCKYVIRHPEGDLQGTVGACHRELYWAYAGEKATNTFGHSARAATPLRKALAEHSPSP